MKNAGKIKPFFIKTICLSILIPLSSFSETNVKLVEAVLLSIENQILERSMLKEGVELSWAHQTTKVSGQTTLDVESIYFDFYLPHTQNQQSKKPTEFSYIVPPYYVEFFSSDPQAFSDQLRSDILWGSGDERQPGLWMFLKQNNHLAQVELVPNPTIKVLIKDEFFAKAQAFVAPYLELYDSRGEVEPINLEPPVKGTIHKGLLTGDNFYDVFTQLHQENALRKNLADAPENWAKDYRQTIYLQLVNFLNSNFDGSVRYIEIQSTHYNNKRKGDLVLAYGKNSQLVDILKIEFADGTFLNMPIAYEDAITTSVKSLPIVLQKTLEVFFDRAKDNPSFANKTGLINARAEALLWNDAWSPANRCSLLLNRHINLPRKK
jgi:hypothetical protein